MWATLLIFHFFFLSFLHTMFHSRFHSIPFHFLSFFPIFPIFHATLPSPIPLVLFLVYIKSSQIILVTSNPCSYSSNPESAIVPITLCRCLLLIYSCFFLRCLSLFCKCATSFFICLLFLSAFFDPCVCIQIYGSVWRLPKMVKQSARGQQSNFLKLR